MKTLSVEELCKSIIDCPHSTPIWKDSGIRVIRNFNIKNGQLDFSDGYFVDEETYSERTKRALPETDDLIISREAPMGEVCIIPKDLKCCLGQRLVLLKINKEICFPKYLLYMMQSKYVQMQIGIINKTGSIVSNLNIPDLKALKIPYRSLQIQQKIAAVLSALDDKIALNRRMNAKLEQMAKRLYDHWFVQFDFPNETGKPYKASGGKMVWNETLKREIPEGCEVKSVNDISISNRGVGYSAGDEKSASDKDVVLILRGNNISNNQIVYDSNTVYLDKSFVADEQKIYKYDIVMTMSSGSKEHVGKSAMFLFNSSHSYGAFCNKITPNKDCQFFLENYLHSEFFKKYIKITCSGTGINNLTNEHFDKALFAFPTEKLLKSFNEKVGSIYEQMGVLEQEIQKLTVLRDRLLPLLMNGQVEVK